jgi:hypothetical protein
MEPLRINILNYLLDVNEVILGKGKSHSFRIKNVSN